MGRNIIDPPGILAEAPDLVTAEQAVRVFAALSSLHAYYPDFPSWYWKKVVPGIADGTRFVRCVERDGRVEAVVIAKRTADECKICTLWTSERLKGTGAGVRLLLQAMDWLGDRRPLLTIPEERIHEFAGLIPKLGFVETEVVESLYRPGCREHVYNGRMTQPVS